MEGIAAHVETLHFGGADINAISVGSGIERAFDFEAGPGYRCSDRPDHGSVIGRGWLRKFRAM